MCSKLPSSRFEARNLASMQGHTDAVFVTMEAVFQDHDWPGAYGDACCRLGYPVHVHAVSPRRSAIAHYLVWQALTASSFAKGNARQPKSKERDGTHQIVGKAGGVQLRSHLDPIAPSKGCEICLAPSGSRPGSEDWKSGSLHTLQPRRTPCGSVQSPIV